MWLWWLHGCEMPNWQTISILYIYIYTCIMKIELFEPLYYNILNKKVFNTTLNILLSKTKCFLFKKMNLYFTFYVKKQ